MTTLALLLATAQAESVPIPDTKFEVELVRVAGGKLQPFWMAKTEVTVDEFLEYYERRERSKVDGITRPSAPYEPPHGAMGAGRHAAVGMRWHGAMGFCEWLTRRTGQKFRLPTEAEWELAARAGSAAEGPEASDDVAWHAGNAGQKTHEVGLKKPNALGLHDLMGNVCEYALEPFTPGEYNPVLRGGGWSTPAEALKFGTRQTILPAWFDRDPNRPRSLWWLTDARFVGFRVLRVGDAAGQKTQQAYADKVQVRALKMEPPKKTWVTVSGEVVNAGDRALSELELTVHFTDANGKPVIEDDKSRPAYTQVYPVLVNSAHAGEHAAPLAPGASRRFTVQVPQAYEVLEDPAGPAARVTGIRFAD
jgi:hypothetical protein